MAFDKNPPASSLESSEFGGAGYVAKDIEACNGIIHVIDTVLN